MDVTVQDAGWEFDHIDAALPPHLNEVFASMRERCPVVYSGKHGGFWAVLSHGAMREAAGDPDRYGSADGIAIPEVVGGMRLPPVECDPPAHGQFRRILQRHFTRQAMARYEPVLRELTRKRIAELAAQPGADLVPGLAGYLPPVAIALILGMPPQDGTRFVSWLTRLFATAVTGDEVANRQVVAEFVGYLDEQLARQQASGADTVMTAVAAGSIDGRALTQDERLGMILLTVLAGHETAINGIGTMLYYLATVEGLRERLVADGALVPRMVEECLRLEAPVIGVARTARADTELAGQPIPAGGRVLLVVNAANRDPEVFDRPEDFDCDRDHSSHLAFGYGIHRCAGEHLARLEMRVVAEEVLHLVPGYRLADGYRPQWIAGRMTRGLATLPVVFG
jgi:cytochrome P450